MKGCDDFLVVGMVFVLCLVALSGCISPQEFVGEPGPGMPETPSPTLTPGAGGPPGGGTGETIPVIREGTSQYYISTPYGYRLATPRTGVKLSIIEIRDEVDSSGLRFISGRIKNDEGSRIDHITVMFNLYNSNGNLIGNAWASVHSLGPGKVWKFSTQSFGYRDYQYYEMAGTFIT